MKLEDLDELSTKYHAILNREDVGDLDDVFQMGGSSGGARHKVMTKEWVIQFPASADMPDIGIMEKEYIACAADCGMIVPETKLMSSRRHSCSFSVRRFDREMIGSKAGRCHMLTAAAILEVDWGTAILDDHTLMRMPGVAWISCAPVPIAVYPDYHRYFLQRPLFSSVIRSIMKVKKDTEVMHPWRDVNNTSSPIIPITARGCWSAPLP